MNNYNYYQNAYMGYPQTNPMQNYQQRPMVNQQAFVPQQQEMQIPIVDIKFVSERKEVEDFIIFPNTAVLLVDKTNGLAYLKMSSGNNAPIIKNFSYSELAQDGKPLNATQKHESIDSEQFIKKTDFESLNLVSMPYFKEQYNKLVEGFNSKFKELQTKIGELSNGKPINE